MSKKSDYFFVNVKQVYPSFMRPSALETEIWEEVLEAYDIDEILAGIKAYRKTEESNYAPNPAKFKSYLFKRNRCDHRPDLPLSPEKYLMEADIKAGRCRYTFPVYTRAVKYVLNVALGQLYPPEEFKTFSWGKRYWLAVENGLFANFDKVLDMVCGGKANG